MKYVKFTKKGYYVHVIDHLEDDLKINNGVVIPKILENNIKFINLNEKIQVRSTEELKNEAEVFESKLNNKMKKFLGVAYELKGETYKVPLTKDAQLIVTTVGLAIMNNAYNETVIEFDNGTKMPIDDREWMMFSRWFFEERNKQFM